MNRTTTYAALAADPALPARDALLDPSGVGQRLERLLGPDGPVSIDDCVLVRAKYRIGESLRVVYRIKVDGRHRVVTARAFPYGASGPAYRRALREVVPTERLRPVAHDAGHDAVWWTFPNDRRMRDLGRLVAPDRDLVRSVGVPGWHGSEVVEYAPERSVTARASDVTGATVAYAKAYAPSAPTVSATAARYRAIAAALRHNPVPVTAPVSLGWSDRHRVLLLQARPGVPWTAVHGDTLLRAMGQLGRGVAALHAATPVVGLPGFGRLAVARVVRSAGLVAQARPDVAWQATQLAARLAASAPSGEERVLLHGDCHPGNVLVDGDAVALIDLDQAGTGPAAADLGSLLARLRHGALLAGGGAGTADDLGASFLVGYAEVRALPAPSSLAWHTAAALVAERALRAVNRVNLTALDRLSCLLADTDHVLTSGVSR